MKKNIAIRVIARSFILSLPVLLTGCESMQDYFNNPTPPRYYKYEEENQPIAKTAAPKQAIIRKSEVTATTLADPGTPSVTMPKTTKTTKSATVSPEGPTVPSMAPTIGQ